jgi:type VI protein secretion system component VasF
VAGFGKGESAVEIKPLDRGCELHYTVHSSVGGKIAQLGQRLIDGVAKNMAEDFFKRFEAELEKRYPPAQEPSATEAAPTAKQSAGVPAWMWAAGAAVVAVVVFMVAR